MIKQLQKVLFFLIFLHSWILADESSIDERDALAIEFSSLAFHAHGQFAEGQEIDLSQPVTRSHKFLGIIPFQTTRQMADPQFLDGWQIEPIYGARGAEGRTTNSLVGLFAYNREKNLAVLTFRGSQIIQDWVHNANPRRRSSDYLRYDGKLHAGYLDAFERCIPSMQQAQSNLNLTAEEIENIQVIVTGHSLGGSVASLAAGFLSQTWPHVELRIFGAPRVGDWSFNSWLTTRPSVRVVKSFVRASDPAPNNPSSYGLAYLGEYVELADYGDWWFVFPMSHDYRKYRHAIYMALNREASLHDNFWVTSWILNWIKGRECVL